MIARRTGRAPRASRPTSWIAAWAATDWTLARAVRTARFWWIMLGYFTGLFAWYAVQVHQTKYLIEIGFSPSYAAWALGFVSLAGIPGQIALGHISDRIGREWVWTVGSLGFAICYLALLLLRDSPSPALLYLMVVSQGLLGYGLTSVVGAIPAEIFQGRHYGSIFGMLMLAVDRRRGHRSVGDRRVTRRHRQLRAGVLDRDRLTVVSAAAIWLAAPRKVRLVAGRVRQVAG